MSTRTTWRWSSLLVVVTMIVSMAAATVSASPAPARPETATAAPAQQPPPPEAKKAPESVHPARPQPPAVSPEEALRKIHPDLRDLAQKASPPLPDQVGTLAGPSSEPIIIEVVAEEGADLSAYFVGGKAIVRPPLSKGEKKTQIFIGFAYPYTLMKIASLAQVEAIIPIVLERTAEPEPYPPDQPRELPKKGPEDWAQLRANAAKLREGWPSWDQAKAFGDGRPDIRPADWFEVMPEGPHQAKDAWERGYTGEGVTVAVLDDGIDPAHPDLLGTQKIYSSTVRPQYNGWPYVFSPFSMLLYAFDSFFGTTYIADGYPGVHYVDTSATPTLYPCGVGISCFKYTPLIDYGVPGFEHTYVISNTMTKSGVVHVGTHPDNDLRDFLWGEKVAVLVTDPNVAGVYDTVYVDLDDDYDFRDEKPLTRANVNDPSTYNNMIAYRDVNGDGLADISGGMVYFIADGSTPIPGSDWIYGPYAPPPANGALVAFSGSTFDRDYSHGTQCASNIVGQGRTNAMLPTFSDLPGDGKPAGAVFGMAPDAKVVNISDIYYNFDSSVIDAYIFAAVGYDACDQTGYNLLTGGSCTDSDAIQITTNSYGESDVDNDGWDYKSQVVSQVQRWWAPYLQFLFSTGNGAPAYGTVAPPTPDTAIGVGASTEFGSTGWDSITSTTQIMFNDVIPFSNRGPGARGTNGVDVVAGGAYAAGAEELNYYSVSTWGVPDGNRSWASWGGTSRSAPVAGGVLALIYQAYKDANGDWPTYDVAKALLKASATDLNYDTFTQGAGSVNADRGTAVAGGLYGIYAMPDEWDPGDYRGNNWPGFAHIVYPGNAYTRTITVYNPGAEDVTADVEASELILIGAKEFTFTVTPAMVAAESAYGSANRDNFFKAFNYFIPITATEGVDPSWYNIPIPAGTDLMIVRQIYPYSQFDVNGDYTWDQRFYLTVYNWKDVNGDGNVWEDKDGNGVVNFINDPTTFGQQADGAIELKWDDPRTELDRWEFGRFGYNRPGGNTYEVWVHDPLERMHDGIFIGLRHLYNAAGGQHHHHPPLPH
jgi:subtilisin family serine protease